MNLKYRKKPIVIEAFQIRSDHWSTPSAWPPWLREAAQKPPDAPGAAFASFGLNGMGQVEIFTLEGIHTGKVGDWIIRGVENELYPCRDDIFRKTYEPVDEGGSI